MKNIPEVAILISWLIWAAEQAGDVFDCCESRLQFSDDFKDGGETVSFVCCSKYSFA